MANECWNKIKNLNEKNKTWFWGGTGGVIITLMVTVILTIYSNIGKQNPNSTIKNNNITTSGSNNNTLNNLQATEGNISIVAGNGNINKTIIQGIPHQEYLRLGKELGVTENAVNNFFKIIKKKEVSKLIAVRYELLNELFLFLFLKYHQCIDIITFKQISWDILHFPVSISGIIHNLKII